MLEKYKTILKNAEIEIIEKKSRFIANISEVSNEKEARLFIDEIKKKYWNASHNVFAFQIGEKNELQRFSDDGEPQGTAGMPVLNVLKGEDIKNAVIVVTRYFGGTLLGTGGLVKAYGKAAKEVVLCAGIVQMILYHIFSVKIDYSYSGKIQYQLLQDNYVIYDTIYTDVVEYIVLIETEQIDIFKKSMLDISNGKAEINFKEKKYGLWYDEKLKLK